MILTSCQSNKQKDHSKAIVSVTILPQKYLIDQISGNTIQVNVMVPKGGSPATYEPTSSQLSSLSESIYYFSTGNLGFEKAWQTRLQKVNPAMKIIDQSIDLQLIRGIEHHGDHHHEGGIDPHIWMSPKNMIQMSTQIFEALSSINPQLKEQYQQNHQRLTEKIKALDIKTAHEMKTISGAKFMIFHPSLSYFARDYNLQQISIEREGKQPSSAHIQSIIQTAQKNSISTIFIQAEFSQEAAKAIAKEVNAEIVVLNPLEYEWLDNIQSISLAIKQSFTKNNPSFVNN